MKPIAVKVFNTPDNRYTLVLEFEYNNKRQLSGSNLVYDTLEVATEDAVYQAEQLAKLTENEFIRLFSCNIYDKP